MNVFECTEETPWTPQIVADQFVHPKATEVGEQEDGWPAGDIVTYECPICKHRWKVELPQ